MLLRMRWRTGTNISIALGKDCTSFCVILREDDETSARVYYNEKYVGKGIRGSGIPQ
jgi:hypothetical protein